MKVLVLFLALTGYGFIYWGMGLAFGHPQPFLYLMTAMTAPQYGG